MLSHPRLLPAALALLVIAACSRQDEVATTSHSDTLASADGTGDPRIATDGLTGEQTLPSPTPGTVPDTGIAAHTVKPVGGNRAEVRGQLRTEAARLDGHVKSGRMAAVVASSTRVRDLAVSLGGKTAGLPRESILQIEQDITAVTEITENMRLQAQAGKPDGVKVQNDLLQPIVTRILKSSAG